MKQILNKWRAGFTRRWHSNPDLCHTSDPVDGHEARTVKIALLLKPDLSRDAIILGLLHDDGETGLGDVSGLWKRNNPILAKALAEAEAANLIELGIALPTVSKAEAEIIRVSDKIDAYLWMMNNKPELAETDDWKGSKSSILASLTMLWFDGIPDSEEFREFMDYFDK